jgi:PAS domain S-box-containing protein
MKASEPWNHRLGTTDEALFVSDEEGRIAYWNEGAERLLGHKQLEVLGKPCCSITGGRRAGRPWCEADCRVRRSMRRGVLPGHVTVEVQASDGRTVPVNVSFIIFGHRGKEFLVHLLQDVSRQEQMREALRGVRGLVGGRPMRRTWLASAPPPRPKPSSPPEGPVVHPDVPDLSRLTRRESEVLRLLSEGLEIETIAAQLGVSPLTARNHIQNVLRKMGLHSRTQAVALALEQGLH